MDKRKRPAQAETLRSNTFRHHYRELTPEESARVERIKDLAELLEKEFLANKDPGLMPSRCMDLATTKLEEAVMWAVKGVTE